MCTIPLRSAEVAHMTLDDINWDAGELLIRGKGNRQDRLPLPKTLVSLYQNIYDMFDQNVQPDVFSSEWTLLIMD